MAHSHRVPAAPVVQPPDTIVLELSLDEAAFVRGLVAVTSIADRREIFEQSAWRRYPVAERANDADAGYEIYVALDDVLGEYR